MNTPGFLPMPIKSTLCFMAFCRLCRLLHNITAPKREYATSLSSAMIDGTRYHHRNMKMTLKNSCVQQCCYIVSVVMDL